MLLIVPWAVPAFVSAFAWRFLFDQRFGLINARPRHHRPRPASTWFDHRWTSLFTAIVTNIWLGVPFMMVAMLGGLQSIPATSTRPPRWTAPRRGSGSATSRCPGLRPVSSTVILLGTIWTFNMFPIIYFVTRGQPAGQTEILVTGAFRAAFEGIRNYSLAATYGVLILSMLMVFATVYRRVLQAGRGVLMADLLPAGTIEPAEIDGADGPDRRPAPARAASDRSSAPASRCTARCSLATFIALFPVVWVLLSSFKPAYAIRRSEITLFDDPTLENYRTCCSTPTSRTGSSTRWSSRRSRWSSASRCPPPRATR